MLEGLTQEQIVDIIDAEPYWGASKENFRTGDKSQWRKLPFTHFTCGGALWVRTVDRTRKDVEQLGGCEKCLTFNAVPLLKIR
jgi:hypothetical protein